MLNMEILALKFKILIDIKSLKIDNNVYLLHCTSYTVCFNFNCYYIASGSIMRSVVILKQMFLSVIIG